MQLNFPGDESKLTSIVDDLIKNVDVSCNVIMLDDGFLIQATAQSFGYIDGESYIVTHQTRPFLFDSGIPFSEIRGAVLDMVSMLSVDLGRKMFLDYAPENIS